MLGLPGLDPFGLVHASFGLASVVLGLGVVLLRKGTLLHRRIGLLYAATMLALNVTALAIYDLFGGFGPFHVLALVSLATTAAGVLHIWLQRPRATWMDFHARWMSWSYAGVLSAFVAEIATRLPGVDFVTGVLVPTALINAGAGLLIHTSVPRTLAHLTGERR